MLDCWWKKISLLCATATTHSVMLTPERAIEIIKPVPISMEGAGAECECVLIVKWPSAIVEHLNSEAAQPSPSDWAGLTSHKMLSHVTIKCIILLISYVRGRLDWSGDISLGCWTEKNRIAQKLILILSHLAWSWAEPAGSQNRGLGPGSTWSTLWSLAPDLIISSALIRVLSQFLTCHSE